MTIGQRLIKIEARYYAYLREITGKFSEIILINEGATINDFLRIIIDKYGERMRRYILDDNGEVRSNITIAINAQKIAGDSVKSYPLKNEDVVVIIPPIAGGIIYPVKFLSSKFS